MNVHVTQDERQPWHLIARIGGGYSVVDHGNFVALNALVNQAHEAKLYEKELTAVPA